MLLMETPESPSDMSIEPIVKSHVVKDFDCGQYDINLYIHRFAKKNTLAGFGRTYVLLKPGHLRVWAYYTLAAHSIEAKEFPTSDNCPQRISVVTLGRFGIDNSLRSKGYGDVLMAHAFGKALEAADAIGVHGIFLTAKNRKLVKYYSKYDFESMPNNPLNMFISIPTLKKAE